MAVKNDKKKSSWDRSDYVEVRDRITEFLQKYPDGLIQTRLVHVDGAEVIVEARVYKSPEDVSLGAFASDLAREVEGKGYINETSHVENCSTSAIGRALANLGYSLSKKRPSREEMLKVGRQQQQLDAYTEYLAANLPQVSDEIEATVYGKQVSLKGYARENWADVTSQTALARILVDAVEKATGVAFSMEE